MNCQANFQKPSQSVTARKSSEGKKCHKGQMDQKKRLGLGRPKEGEYSQHAMPSGVKCSQIWWITSF
jgi:hypothetical protein